MDVVDVGASCRYSGLSTTHSRTSTVDSGLYARDDPEGIDIKMFYL